MKIVICGGGIIGATTAYFLAKLKVSCIIVEETSLACAASGKAGGFLARNWCSSNECDNLAKLSYDLHMEFARLYPEVDYRKVNTYAASINNLKPEKCINLDPEHSWIDGPVTEHSLLDTVENTSQVNPQKLCERLIAEASRMTDGKTRIIIDSVIGVEMDESQSDAESVTHVIRGVRLKSGTVLPADKILIAMGPWSHKAANWFKACNRLIIPHVFGHRAHSIVLSDSTGEDDAKQSAIPAECLFLQYRNSKGIFSPEIYPRPDGTVYVSGFSDDMELPDQASEIVVEKWRCTALREVAYATCSGLEPGDVIAEQACYLPMTDDGIPIIGRLSGIRGGFIATGHSCWGILNSTGTGLAMAELMVLGQSRRLDLKAFDPNRFNNKK